MRLSSGKSRLTTGLLVPGMISSPPVDILFEDQSRSSGRMLLVMSIVVHFVSLAHAICN